MCGLNNYINTYKLKIKPIKKWYTKKQSLDVKLFTIARKQENK